MYCFLRFGNRGILPFFTLLFSKIIILTCLWLDVINPSICSTRKRQHVNDTHILAADNHPSWDCAPVCLFHAQFTCNRLNSVCWFVPLSGSSCQCKPSFTEWDTVWKDMYCVPILHLSPVVCTQLLLTLYLYFIARATTTLVGVQQY